MCDEFARYNSSALNTLKAGDIVRYSNNGHSIFILGVEGDTVTFVDANGDGRCQIYWDRTTTKAQLKSTFTYVNSAPYALPAEPASGMSLTAAKASVTMGQTVTVTLRYEGGGKTIGALMGTLKYDTAAFAFDSHVGTDVEVNDVDGSIRYVYCASQAQAPEAVEMAFTFTAVGGGKSTFVATTEEFVSDGDYVSLGTPTEQVAVTVVVMVFLLVAIAMLIMFVVMVMLMLVAITMLIMLVVMMVLQCFDFLLKGSCVFNSIENLCSYQLVPIGSDNCSTCIFLAN